MRQPRATEPDLIPRSDRGFSLIELLTVILIIFVVLALVIPALDGARNVARTAATQSVMKGFGNAVDQFRQDHAEAVPGIYSPERMGDPENADRYGFTAMENVLLDLAGGVQSFASNPPEPWEDFGPDAAAHADELYVNPDLIGAQIDSNPGYWTPPERFTEIQERGPSPSQQFSTETDDAEIIDVIDAWGNPMMLWVDNPLGPQEIDEIESFAEIDNTNGPSRFYWASNAGHLKATALGRGGEDQTVNNARPFSLLGDGNSDAELRRTMTAVLGSPAFPAASVDLQNPTRNDQFLPGDARGSLFMHSAGIDGVYLGSRDQVARQFDAASGGLPYWANFFSTGGTRWARDGSPTTRDVLEGFDDMVQTFGD